MIVVSGTEDAGLSGLEYVRLTEVGSHSCVCSVASSVYPVHTAVFLPHNTYGRTDSSQKYVRNSTAVK